MITYYSAKDVRSADILAVESYRIPSSDLMENAGTNAAREVLKQFPAALSLLILAGPGNNGGDGFVAARVFLSKGLSVTVLLSSDFERYKGDAKLNLDALIAMKDSNCTVRASKNLSDAEIRLLVRNSDCVIDSLLGTGSSGPPRGESARLIDLCCRSGPVVSFDLPSGIDPETGEVYEPCVKALLTVTFLSAKRGMCFSPAYERCGTITVAGIGIEPEKVLAGCVSLCSYDRKDIVSMLPTVPSDTHKGKRGGVLIVGGSVNYRGAPILAGLGALRSGAGLVVLAVPDFMVDSASVLLPEAIFVPLKTKGEMIVTNDLRAAIEPWENRCSILVLGPGLGRGPSSEAAVKWFWEKWKKPLLVDGDALFYLKKDGHDDLGSRKDAILTPHHGEAANILGLTAAEVSSDRPAAAASLLSAAEVALLKGRDTIVASRSHPISVIKEGSPALAVPGSGDVLSGCVGALAASGIALRDSAVLGALIHGAAGRNAECKSGRRGTLAREIADALPLALL